jgi:hypothetical protein
MCVNVLSALNTVILSVPCSILRVSPTAAAAFLVSAAHVEYVILVKSAIANMLAVMLCHTTTGDECVW